MTTTFEIEPRGPFDLREAALFGFGSRAEKRFDGVMRLAFCVDGTYDRQVGVELRQADDGRICGVQHGTADGMAVRAQVARVLSLDHDGDDFHRVGRRDPAIGNLQRVAPGLRPVLFHSPYEAAAWGILSIRRARPQAMALRDRLARDHGRTFRLAGVEQHAFPAPAALLALTEVPGLPEQKVEWLHGVARAAMAGQLSAATLAAEDPDEAMARLRRINGIGPFYSALIQLRSTGVTDVLPTAERHVLAAAGRLYGYDRPLRDDEFAERAEPWRPWRTWASVLIRAATPRLEAAADVRGGPRPGRG